MGKELWMQCTETTHICQTSRSSRQPHASMVLLEKGTEAKPLKEALGASETGQHQHGRFWKSDPREEQAMVIAQQMELKCQMALEMEQ